MPADWTCCGAPINGSIARPWAATKRASGGAAMTSMTGPLWARPVDRVRQAIENKGRDGRDSLAQPCRDADLCRHGAAHGFLRQPAADALFGGNGRIASQRDGSDVSADGRVSFRPLGEADRLKIGVTLNHGPVH